MTRAGCPQWWRAFAVRGNAGIYEVYADDVLRGRWRCSCPAWRFGGRTTCKHIERIHRHGCFGDGPNDLRAFGVEITGDNPMRAAQPTGLRCACGQMMLAPLMRVRDDAGRQIVELREGASTYTYTYAWAGRVLAVGDVVTVGQYRDTVVALGSDYLGELKVIGDRRVARIDEAASTNRCEPEGLPSRSQAQGSAMTDSTRGEDKDYDPFSDPIAVEIATRAIAAAASSIPVWATEFGGMIFTVI